MKLQNFPFDRGERLKRNGAAVVELAVLLPLLVFLLVVAIDYARLFYFTQTVVNCSRNGAIWASDTFKAAESPYKTVEEAAKADAPSFMHKDMTVKQSSGTDSSGDHVVVTVTYPFSTVTGFPGIPSNHLLTRSVRMRVTPTTPDNAKLPEETK